MLRGQVMLAWTAAVMNGLACVFLQNLLCAEHINLIHRADENESKMRLQRAWHF